MLARRHPRDLAYGASHPEVHARASAALADEGLSVLLPRRGDRALPVFAGACNLRRPVPRLGRHLADAFEHGDALAGCDLKLGSELGRVDDDEFGAVTWMSGKPAFTPRNTLRPSSTASRGTSVALPGDLPPVMTGRRRIAPVLNNLFANAARHSPESASIRVSAMRDGVHVAVSVRDEGKGVAPELLPQLFRKYTGASGARAVGGTGFGLVICKGLVEAHGGRIRAESAGPGRRARFTFTVPVVEDARDAQAAGPRVPGPTSETGECSRSRRDGW